MGLFKRSSRPPRIDSWRRVWDDWRAAKRQVAPFNGEEGTGELDASRYGDLLWPGGLVDVRGVGHSYEGDYTTSRALPTVSARVSTNNASP
jgi:hypothetical protein